ncbi:unnamed protein product [Mucor fragilis]
MSSFDICFLDDRQYPDKVVAVVSAAVAIFFVCIVRLVWSMLYPFGDASLDNEAVCAAHHVAPAAARKYGMSHQDPLVESASSFSSSVSGSRPNHTPYEYRAPVDGSALVASPSLIIPESNAVFAISSFMDELRKSDVEKIAYRMYAYKNVENASNCVSRFLPVEKQLAAVPYPAAVADASADASWRSDLAESSNVSLSSACRSTGISDNGAFAVSASNVTDMTKAVDAAVSLSRVAGTDFLGDDASIPSTTACFGAEIVVVAALCCGYTNAGTSGNATLTDDAPVLGAVSSSGVTFPGASSSAALVFPVLPTASICTIRGPCVSMKRCSDWEFALFAHQEHAKKYKKIVPVIRHDSFLPVNLEVSDNASGFDPTTKAMEICPPSPMLLDSACSAVEFMEICPQSPTLIGVASPAVKPMDYSNDEFASSLVPEASPMDITAVGLLSFGLLPVNTTLTAASSEALLTATASISTAASTTVSTTTTSRCIAYPRARSGLRRPTGYMSVAQHRLATYTTTPAASPCAAAATTLSPTIAANTTIVAAATTTTATPIAAKTVSLSTVEKTTQVNQNSETATIKNNKGSDENQLQDTETTTEVELEECSLDPKEILDPNEYPVENYEYDEFEEFDFTEALDFSDRLS